MDKFKVSVVLPCQNEEKNVTIIVNKLVPILKRYADYEIIMVDDGSKDNTLAEMKSLAKANKRIKFISLSRNFTQQNAIRAGLDFTSGDCVICMDADMQQPPELLPKMIKLWQEGYDVVYTIRKAYGHVSAFKKFTSKFFYRVINMVSDVGIEDGAADFRLMDKLVVEALRQYTEKYIFYRGIVASMGFKQTSVAYDYMDRLHGKTQYSLKKMLTLASSGVTGFSSLPLHFSTLIGCSITAISSLYALYALVFQLSTGTTAASWSALMFAILFIGGIQLLMIGILGEYLGKMFFEVKKRPNYIIREKSF